jgi:ATP-binding cassette subfamily C protein CydC
MEASMKALATPLFRILTLWRGRAGWLFAAGVVTLASLASGLALAGVAGGLFAGLASGAVFASAALLRALGPLRVVLRYFERLVGHEATFRALADLRVWFFRGLCGSAAGGLGFLQRGDVLSRLVNDIEALDGLTLRVLLPWCGAVLILAVFLGFYIPLAPWAGIGIGLLFAGAAFVLPLLAARAAVMAGGRLARATAALRVATLDTLTGLREVRAFGAEGRMLASIQAREGALLAAQDALSRRGARIGALAFLCGQAAIGLALAAAALHMVPQTGAAVAGTFIVVAGFETAAGLAFAGVQAGSASAAASRVLAAAEMPPPVPEPRRPAALPVGNGLRFEAVTFRWRPERPDVFRALSLDIPAGARVAVLGPSGSGKSTLAALALRLAAPQAGRVLLGGSTDIADLPAAAVRQRIAWLSQATHLFDDSLRHNLLLARPEAREADLWAALDAAQIGDFVRALPNGLDSWLGESGTTASGGQGRRLALARALLSAAPILILDEPCAGLDAENERAFLANLNEVTAGRTVLLITHRLTGVERLHRIWRLASGGVVPAAA